MKTTVVVGLISLLVSGCVTIGQAPSLPKGQVLEGSVKYGSYEVPLPDGQWTVIGEYRFQTTHNTTLGDLELAQLKTKKTFEKVITIRTVLNFGIRSGGGWKSSRDCENKDMHYIKKLSNSSKTLECNYVKHLSFIPEEIKKNSTSGQLIGNLSEQGVSVPGNVISSVFIHGNPMNVLLVGVMFNPEADGLSPSPEADWHKTEWNPHNIDNFPERKAYVDKVIAWNQKWAPRYKAAFGR